MNSYKVYFIHGFLGSPKDWEPVLEELQKKITIESVVNLDLFSPSSSVEIKDFKNFVDQVPAPCSDDKNILIGYSLGARLAQHLYLDHPSLWEKVFFLSSNIGLVADIPARRKWEQEWAENFKYLEWEYLLSLWNSQDIFKNDLSVERLEQEFDREKLARSFSAWSLTQHEFTPHQFKKALGNVFWVCGREDFKYFKLQEEYKSIGISGSYESLTGVGHRLFTAPKRLASVLAKSFK